MERLGKLGGGRGHMMRWGAEVTGEKRSREYSLNFYFACVYLTAASQRGVLFPLCWSGSRFFRELIVLVQATQLGAQSRQHLVSICLSHHKELCFPFAPVEVLTELTLFWFKERKLTDIHWSFYLVVSFSSHSIPWKWKLFFCSLFFLTIRSF